MKKLIKKLTQFIPLYREVFHIRDALCRISNDIAVIRASEVVRCEMELEKHPRYGDPLRLFQHEFQVNSQNGEDGIIQEIFRRIGTTDRVFLEVGVGDGNQNNTAFLLSQGWKGFWLDGNDYSLNTLNKKKCYREENIKFKTAFVTKENVTTLFEELEVPKEFDLLSVDIDQNTFHIWEALRAYKPRVVIMEYNSSIPADTDWKVPYRADRIWDGSMNYGASLKAFELLGRECGYNLVGCNFHGINAFFVRDDLSMDQFAGPFTSENHYEPPRYRYGNWTGHVGVLLDRVPLDSLK